MAECGEVARGGCVICLKLQRDEFNCTHGSGKRDPGANMTLSLLDSLLAYRPKTVQSHREHGYLYVVSVVCCQVEVFATS